MSYQVRYTTNKGQVRVITFNRGTSYEMARRYAARLAGHNGAIKSVTICPAS